MGGTARRRSVAALAFSTLTIALALLTLAREDARVASDATLEAIAAIDSARVLVAPEYARSFADNFGVRFVPLRGPAVQREYFVYQRKGQSLSPAGAAFLALLRQRGGAPRRAPAR